MNIRSFFVAPFGHPVNESVLRARLALIVSFLALYAAGVALSANDRSTFEVLKSLTTLVIAIPGAWFAHSLQLATAFRRDRRAWMLDFTKWNEVARRVVGSELQDISPESLRDWRSDTAFLVVQTTVLGLPKALAKGLADVRDRLSELSDNPLYSKGESFRNEGLLRVAREEASRLRTAYHAVLDAVEAEARV